MPIHEDGGTFGHLTYDVSGFIVKTRLILELPRQVSAVGLWKIFRVDECAQDGAIVLAQDVELASCTFVEPSLSTQARFISFLG